MAKPEPKPRPKYIYDENGSTFVNPYNFVQVDFDRKSNAQGRPSDETLTGWIDYRVITRTPLAIPDIENVTEELVGKKKTDMHRTYRFMKTPSGEYIIPGSTMRGVVRNVFETATDSCFSTVKGRQFITARQTDAGNPGILEISKDKKGNLILNLYKAEVYMLKIRTGFSKNGLNAEVWDNSTCPAYDVQIEKQKKYIEFEGTKYFSGDIVHFKPLLDAKNENVQYISKRGIECGKVAQHLSNEGMEGMLVLGEAIFNKHHERIFVEESPLEDEIQEKLHEAYYGLLRTLDIYQDKGVNRNYGKNHTGYKTIESIIKATNNDRSGKIPVYYKNDEGKLYLQLAAMGRVAFNSDMAKLVNKKKPCNKRTDLCKACALFGMIGEERDESNESVGSRVRFTDAVCTNFTESEIKTLAELGAPRVAYMPFYSTMQMRDDPITVGYDHEGIDIRGRKYYWHHYPSNKDLNAEKTGRNATMELLGKDSEFAGKVFFNGITKQELRELIWALNFWENDRDGRYCHKIGHGKPLGLGSCKVVIDFINFRDIKKDEYHCIRKELENCPDFYDRDKMPVDNKNQTITDLLTLLDFNAMNGKKVEYPDVIRQRGKNEYRNENDYARHNWFTENKQNRNRSNMQLLAYPDEDCELHYYKVDIQADDYNRNKGYSGGYNNHNNHNNHNNRNNKRNGKYEKRKDQR